MWNDYFIPILFRMCHSKKRNKRRAVQCVDSGILIIHMICFLMFDTNKYMTLFKIAGLSLFWLCWETDWVWIIERSELFALEKKQVCFEAYGNRWNKTTNNNLFDRKVFVVGFSYIQAKDKEEGKLKERDETVIYCT